MPKPKRRPTRNGQLPHTKRVNREIAAARLTLEFQNYMQETRAPRWSRLYRRSRISLCLPVPCPQERLAMWMRWAPQVVAGHPDVSRETLLRLARLHYGPTLLESLRGNPALPMLLLESPGLFAEMEAAWQEVIGW